MSKTSLRDIDYLQDILDSIEKIRKFIQNFNYTEFEKDDKTLYAVIRAIEIIGEATKKIPNKIRNSYPNVPWREMARMRDKLIHDYLGLNTEVVWETATNDIPQLEPSIRQIISEVQ